MTKFIIGVDEVGRGCVMGDVVAAAVILPESSEETELWDSIKDSKKIRSHDKRCEVAKFIKNVALAYGIGKASCKEIDDMNILKATMLAMHRALDTLMNNFGDALGITPDNCRLCIDGIYFRPAWRDFKHECIVKGDTSIKSISAASILAKVERDTWVLNLVQERWDEFVRYGWHKNMGYGTVEHRTAILEHGPTEFHRMTFIKKYVS